MGKIGLLFPGQGSQFIGMGKELYDSNERCKKLMNTANSILGFNISEIIFNGNEEELKQTEIAQPAIYIVSAMYYEIFKDKNEVCSIMAGHSLGEYSVLYASGMVSFEDGLRLVSRRGQLMRDVEAEGTMCAILGLTHDEVANYLEGEVSIANWNSEKQIVISGEVSRMEKVIDKLESLDNVTLKKLNVSSAFHSSLMEEASEKMNLEIDKVKFEQPNCPVIPNYTAIPTEDIQVIVNALKKQMTGMVKWYSTILSIKSENIEELYECGAGVVLKKINRTITMRPKVKKII